MRSSKAGFETWGRRNHIRISTAFSPGRTRDGNDKIFNILCSKQRKDDLIAIKDVHCSYIRRADVSTPLCGVCSLNHGRNIMGIYWERLHRRSWNRMKQNEETLTDLMCVYDALGTVGRICVCVCIICFMSIKSNLKISKNTNKPAYGIDRWIILIIAVVSVVNIWILSWRQRSIHLRLNFTHIRFAPTVTCVIWPHFLPIDHSFVVLLHDMLHSTFTEQAMRLWRFVVLFDVSAQMTFTYTLLMRLTVAARKLSCRILVVLHILQFYIVSYVL